jgi:crossover junction endodeoxyribonuclease RusA
MEGKRIMESTVILPWPHKDLSPNARVHWAVKAKQVKLARQSAWWMAKHSKLKIADNESIQLYITFFPPDNRAYDEDNLVARCKSLFDGLADGFGVNDNRFRLRHEIGTVYPLGKVQIKIVTE